MRKLLFLCLLVLISGVLMTSCKGKKNVSVITNVEAIISADREAMYLTQGDNYYWFETTALFKNFFDEDADGTVTKVVSVFEVANEVDSLTEFKVFTFTHENGKTSIEENEGPWVEDCVLNDEEIKLTFQEAFDKMMAADIVKPHSQFCVLRKPVGPVEVNTQYIFGNADGAIFVDAVTGDVTDSDPLADKDAEPET